MKRDIFWELFLELFGYILGIFFCCFNGKVVPRILSKGIGPASSRHKNISFIGHLFRIGDLLMAFYFGPTFVPFEPAILGFISGTIWVYF